MKILSERIMKVLKEHQMLAAILGIGFLLRIWGILWGIPFPDPLEGIYHPDEPKIIKGAVEFPGHILTNQNFIYPTFFSYFLGFITFPLRLFFDGFNVPGPGGIGSNFYYVVTVIGRLCSALAGTGSIFLTYLLAKDIYDERRALLAGAFLALTFYHASNSSVATTDVLTSFFLVLFLFVLRRAFLAPESPSLFMISGMILGLLMGTKYTGAIVSLAIVVMYVDMLWGRSRSHNEGGHFNLRTLHVHLLLCCGATIVTFFLTTPGILIQFNGFIDSMAYNFRYVGRWAMPRNDLDVWVAVLQKIVMVVGLPLTSVFLLGLFFPYKKNVHEVIYILILVVYFLYLENRLLPRYVILVAPLVAIIASNGLVWFYESAKKPVHILGLSMMTIVLVYSLGYCLTGGYLRYNDTRTQAAHFIQDTFPQGTTVGLGYVAEEIGWAAHPWRYPQIDLTRFTYMDFLDYPEVLVTSSEYDTTRIEDALKSDKLSKDYVWNVEYNKNWFEFSPPSPRIFRFYEKLWSSERSHYLLLKTFKMKNVVPLEFGSPEINIYVRQSYGPNLVRRTYYPNNPRGYFQEEDPRVWRWQSKVWEGSEANLVFPDEDPQGVRIAISRAGSDVPWHIQLNQAPVAVKAMEKYLLRFRARADHPRSMVLALSQADNPWRNLGLYQEVALTTEWQDFDAEFIATRDELRAQVHFALGGKAVSVEIAGVRLQRKSDILLASLSTTTLSSFGWGIHAVSSDQSQFIEPDLPDRYYVEYRLNAQGCRGRDYPIPRSNQGMRILVLGDSYALGAGVHEADTMASQLESLLHQDKLGASSSMSYEVINCGAGGYGTRDEAVLSEKLVSRYQPDVVLLVMTPDDDQSWVEGAKRGEFDHLRKDRDQFVSWSDHKEKLFQRSSPDYSGSLRAIHDLRQSVQGRGARLVVVLFRNNQDQAWTPLVSQITEGLKETGIPVLDLGTVLLKNQPGQDLTVHENDKHPNEIAHKIAAGAILASLNKEDFFSPLVVPSKP